MWKDIKARWGHRTLNVRGLCVWVRVVTSILAAFSFVCGQLRPRDLEHA